MLEEEPPAEEAEPLADAGEPVVEVPADAGEPVVEVPADAGEPVAAAAAVPVRPSAWRIRMPAGYRPPRRRSRAPGRDPLWARLLVVLGLVLVVLSGSAITASQVVAQRYDASVKRDSLLAPGARATSDERHSTVTGPLNFLLLGSDARTDDPDGGQRSDSIIVVHVPTGMDRAYLMSIPRDLRVQIPPFEATGFSGGHEKINGAFQHGGGGAGGVRLLSETLTNLLGIRFDGAMVIDFGGFQKAVDLLGGVDMCVDVRTESHHIGHDAEGNFLAPYDGPEGEHRNHDSTPVVYEPGCQHLEGWQALDFVRQRKSLPDGDYGRQRHQQQFLRALLYQANTKNLTRNPLALDRFIRVIGESLTVDTNGLGLDDLMFALRGIGPNDLLGVQVPSEPQVQGGISYIIAFPEADSLYAAVQADIVAAWAVENPTWVNQM